MIVMPAPYTIDFDNITLALGAEHVSLAYEHQFLMAFPDCETGAMPPFGNLFDIPVFIADALAKQETISFNAGDHHELITMKTDDLISLANPVIIACGFHEKGFAYQHEHIREGKLRH